MNPPSYYDVIRAMSNWTLAQRMRFIAYEMQNLHELLEHGTGTIIGNAWHQIRLGHFQQAIETLEEIGS